MVTKQGFYSRIHLYDDLTIFVFHFHFRFWFSFPLFPIAPSAIQKAHKITCNSVSAHKRMSILSTTKGMPIARVPYAYYRQWCYRSLVSLQSINLSGQVWICLDILSWHLRILIGSTEFVLRFLMIVCMGIPT